MRADCVRTTAFLPTMHRRVRPISSHARQGNAGQGQMRRQLCGIWEQFRNRRPAPPVRMTCGWAFCDKVSINCRTAPNRAPEQPRSHGRLSVVAQDRRRDGQIRQVLRQQIGELVQGTRATWLCPANGPAHKKAFRRHHIHGDGRAHVDDDGRPARGADDWPPGRRASDPRPPCRAAAA